jgi:hypothetical protein
MEYDRKNIIFIIIGSVVLITASVITGIVIGNLKRKAAEPKGVDAAVSNVESFIEDKVVGSEGTVTEVTARPDIKKIIEVSRLSTFEFTYNSICEVRDDNGNKLYYIAYEGKVLWGIDASQIKFDIDEDNKLLNIILPKVEVQETNVDANTLEYIFFDGRYDNPSSGAQAQALCLDDMKNKIRDQYAMEETARENTLHEVEALFKPIVSQYYSDYKLTIDFVK